ncbi:MAG: ATP-binding protein [Mariprofundaceae bacterium]
MKVHQNRVGSPLEQLARMHAVEVADIDQTAWDSIVGMQNEKETVEKKIILPFVHSDLAKKHGITIPKGILLFGPPGTGKTSFARGIAGRLGWKFVEVSPSALGSAYEKESQELKFIFDQLRLSEKIVLFFDEFEELVLNPEQAGKDERLTSNEFLRQLPKVKDARKVLFVCATNNIRILHPALLRPGRFDLIFPVGPLNKESVRLILEDKIRAVITTPLDIDRITDKMECFTPADIEAVVAQVAQKAFEQEVTSKKEYQSTTDDFMLAASLHQPTISQEGMKAFRKDAKKYCRADYCHLF